MILLILDVALGGLLLLIFLGYFLLMHSLSKKRPNWKSNELGADGLVDVSLIIATYNEEATLPAKLENVLAQDYSKERLELVVVDSGSTDQTLRIAEKFARQNPCMRIVLIHEKERLGKSHAVNIAYSKASGEIKIISDADALLEKSAISKIVGNFNDPQVGAACGRQVLLNPNQNLSTMLEKGYRNVYEILREGESTLDSTPIFHGELAAYRAGLIEPLPENKSADDSRLANTIRRKGFRAVYDREAVFYEYAPSTLHARFIQKVRRGQGLIRVFWDFRGCLFRRKYGEYGLVILPMEFFLHCIFPLLLLPFLMVFFFLLASYNPIMLLPTLVLFTAIVLLSRVKANNRILKNMTEISNVCLSFLISQLLLLYALILWASGRSLHKWQKVEDVRKQWSKSAN